MVHALKEIWRVLQNSGLLIDLRPILDQWPVEITSSGEILEAGRATDLLEPLADDEAANQAIAGISKQGWFLREQEQAFPFFYYWDTPKEMQDYIDDTWDDVITIDDELWSRLRSMWATANADASVRIRLKMSIASWRKQKFD
jgi:hypothetical protein